MNLYYTWHDVQRQFQSRYVDWPETWLDVDVYKDEVVITTRTDFTNQDLQNSLKLLGEFFGPHFMVAEEKIRLDFDERVLSVIFEEDFSEDGKRKKGLPLFKDQWGRFDQPEPLQGAPVIAFHSYKGGVGRTLSMLAMVRAMSAIEHEGRPMRLLLVDGDLEAPGLTWLAQEDGLLSDMSLLDALALVHEEKDWRQTALPFISRKIEETMLGLPVGGRIVEHYFLPAYRRGNEEQVVSLPVTLENLVHMVGREWIVGDFLSELGANLGVDVVLMDLRAGVSEFAAPLLFDPRVRKVFVTSTNLQSRRGMRTVLEQIYSKPLRDGDLSPVVLVSKVLDELGEEKQREIKEEILAIEKWIDPTTHSPLGLQVEFLPFTSSLVHLEGFDTIDSKLGDTRMAKGIGKITEEWFGREEEVSIPPEERMHFLEGLTTFTDQIQNPESAWEAEFLTTSLIKNIVRRYKYAIPAFSVFGASGTGKTFLFLQILRAKSWENFVQKLEKDLNPKHTTHVIPLLWSKKLSDASIGKIEDTIDELNQKLEMQIRSHPPVFSNLDERSEEYWKRFWINYILECLGGEFESLQDLQKHLTSKNERIVLLMDGIEEYLQVLAEPIQKIAFDILSQQVINEMRVMFGSRIGLILWAPESLGFGVGYDGRFDETTNNYLISWDFHETLRLILWLASQVEDKFKTKIPIENMTQELLIDSLTPLLRKEVKMDWFDLWLVLVDLNQGVVASDIVSLLHFTAQESQGQIYNQSYLIPSAVARYFVQFARQHFEQMCDSKPQLREVVLKIKQEAEPYQEGYLEKINLTSEEIKLLEDLNLIHEFGDYRYPSNIFEIILKNIDAL